MPRSRRALAALLTAALSAGSCGPGPVVTEAPASERATATPTMMPSATEIPFTPAAWPAAGSACDDLAYAGRLGRIEAPDALTVRFTLCSPDGAFRARLAHPSLAVVDATSIGRMAAVPGAARMLAGTGPYRIDAWRDDHVELVLARPAPDGRLLETVVIGWNADAGARTAAIRDAIVDGIDAPDAAAAETMDTQPELAVIPRPGLATAYLGFGSGTPFRKAGVRRAIAMGLDTGVIAAALGPGTIPATAAAPCSVPGGCGGKAWWPFDVPSATAALAAARFDLQAPYQLRIPDAPMPGLPDPASTAAAVEVQLRTNLGLRVEIEVVPAAAFAADLAAGRIAGLYLAGVASALADASGFLEPLFGPSVATTAAGRATAVADALDTLARTVGTNARATLLAAANDGVRAAVPIVPLVHPGSVAAYRSDVTGVAASPLGLDALGSFVPADRRQLVFLGAGEPDGGWCGAQATLDAFRLCGLVTEGLYGFTPGTLDPEPRLAVHCGANADATTWTCRLRRGVTFQDGMRLDAGDVLASFVALWDGGSPLRRSAPAGAFAVWDALLGVRTGATAEADVTTRDGE